MPELVVAQCRNRHTQRGIDCECHDWKDDTQQLPEPIARIPPRFKLDGRQRATEPALNEGQTGRPKSEAAEGKGERASCAHVHGRA